MTLESAAYHFSILPREEQIKLRDICQKYDEHDVRYIEIRNYCNQFLFDYVVRGLNIRMLVFYLEKLYL